MGWDDVPVGTIVGSMTKDSKRPRDPNQLGKLIVDLAAGEAV